MRTLRFILRRRTYPKAFYLTLINNAVGRDGGARGEEHQVAGHEEARVHDLRLPVALHVGQGLERCTECRHRVTGLEERVLPAD